MTVVKAVAETTAFFIILFRTLLSFPHQPTAYTVD